MIAASGRGRNAMRLKSVVAAMLLLLPAPALADVTARYAVEGKDQLVIEADDGGNARLSLGEKFMLIRRDGVDYIIAADASGKLHVAPFDGVAEVLSGQFKGLFAAGGDAEPEMTFILEPGAQETIAGREGMGWRFGPGPKDGKPGDLIDVVMSADPALAPIGQVFQRAVATLGPVIGLYGGDNLTELAGELFAKGTPLRVGAKFRLDSVDMADLPASRFELDGPVLEPMEWFEAIMPSASGAGLPPLP
jgi:hypothetical protein